jgi:MoxR-like ATPase
MPTNPAPLPRPSPSLQGDVELLERLSTARTDLLAQVGRRIIGQTDVLDGILTAIFSGGHALLLGVPGLAKTLMVQTVAQTLDLKFSRIQFTPDLMPSDITGTEIIEEDQATGKRGFRFVRGPVFANIVLADEVNRTPPKTQAALLQAMQEHQVTAAGQTHPLPSPFFVLATQNPIEQEGTYPLPEAQLDRFLFKILIDHPSRDEEREIVRRHGHRSAMPRLEDFDIKAIAESSVLAKARLAVTNIRLTEPLVDYIVDVVRATRAHSSLEVGASTRAANMLAAAVRAFAVLQGRDFVIPDDIKLLALPVLRHRLTISPSAEIEGLTADRILREVLDQTPAPR